jgi:hypothetical protein
LGRSVVDRPPQFQHGVVRGRGGLRRLLLLPLRGGLLRRDRPVRRRFIEARLPSDDGFVFVRDDLDVVRVVLDDDDDLEFRGVGGAGGSRVSAAMLVVAPTPVVAG